MRNSDLNEMRELESLLISTRKENQELREKWSTILSACCNAEDEARVATEEVGRLQNVIEDNYLARTDLETKAEQLANNLHVAQGELRHIKLEHTNTTAKYESRIATLLSDVEYYKNNHQYALEHKAEQDKLISEVKFVVQKLRDENNDLKAKQVNAEHLANKVITLQQQLETLEKTFKPYQCPYQKTKDSIHLPCGTCVQCQLDASYGIIDRVSANIEKVERDKKKLETQHELVQEELNAAVAELNQFKEKASKLQMTITTLEESNRHYSDCLTQQLEINTKQKRTIEALSQIVLIMKTGLSQIARPFTFFRKRRAKKFLLLAATFECGVNDAKPNIIPSKPAKDTYAFSPP